MDKRVLTKRFVTSDYSSDDGENEVSSSLQNFKNQTVENTSTTKVNGELSALKVYRQAGEYWNKYPKTDYTYSHHSKDRVEISPGVIQMPNMSRNSIHKSPITNTSPNVQFIANKACSTDSFLGTTSSTQDYSTETILRPRNLFSTSRPATNNNTLNGDGYKQHHYSSSSSSSRYSREQASVVVRIWRYLLTWTYFLYEVQSQSTLWAMKRFYRFACWVLLMDRWLLTRTSSRMSASNAMDSMERRDDGKIKKLVALCGIPLLILGGWFLFWGLASLFSNRPVAVNKIIVLEDLPPNHPNFKHQSESFNAADIASALSQEQLLIISKNIHNIVNINNNDNSDLLEKLLQNPNFLSMVTERLMENVNIEAAMKTKTVDNLNEEQTLKHNSYFEKEILDKLLQNPIFLNIIKNTNDDSMKNQDALNKQFQDQIQNLRLGLAADSKAEFHRFEHQLRRCCRNSLIATEKYVLDILKNIFQAPNSLNQADFSHWLRTVFVARDDLETRLGNLTASLSEKHNAMIEENGRLLMDEVALRLREHALLTKDNNAAEDIDYERITAQLREELQSGTSSITKVTHEDEYIKRIVKTVLEIYDADKTGLVDYALQSSGAEVLSTKCTEPYHRSFAVMSVFGIPLWHLYKPPHTVLTPNVNPGECWAFQSFPGYMVIKLTHRIHVEAISYEHVNKLLIPDGRIDSAPNKFSVYGVQDPDDNKNEPLLLGEFVYDVNGDPLQFFIVQSNNYTGETPAFGYVELRVNTNHGNPNYTCLYRLRIHGKLAATDHPS